MSKLELAADSGGPGGVAGLTSLPVVLAGPEGLPGEPDFCCMVYRRVEKELAISF